jgi:ABC-type multidrug transport system ATPase subunit
MVVTEPPLLARNLSKAFGRKQVIAGFTHRFDAGVHAIVGPNGIGKTTLLSLLAGAVAPDAGDVNIAGFDLRSQPIEAKLRLGYAPDEKSLYPFMTGRELLDLVACAKRLDAAAQQAHLVEAFGLKAQLELTFGRMSEGTRKKFALTAALLGNPAVIIMDEPGNALDTESLAFLVAKIKQAAYDKVVVMATHDRELIESTDAAIIGSGAFTRTSR